MKAERRLITFRTFCKHCPFRSETTWHGNQCYIDHNQDPPISSKTCPRWKRLPKETTDEAPAVLKAADAVEEWIARYLNDDSEYVMNELNEARTAYRALTKVVSSPPIEQSDLDQKTTRYCDTGDQWIVDTFDLWRFLFWHMHQIKIYQLKPGSLRGINLIPECFFSIERFEEWLEGKRITLDADNEDEMIDGVRNRDRMNFFYDSFAENHGNEEARRRFAIFNRVVEQALRSSAPETEQTDE